MTHCFVGVDLGTGGAKAAVINDQGETLGYAFEEFTMFTEKPGWSEHDAFAYWDIVCRLIRESMTKGKVDPRDVKGIAVSSALPALVMVDENHNPLQRSYNLLDRRATAEVQWLKDHFGEMELFNITANRLEDHPTWVNLMWEKNNRPDSFAKIYKALTPDGYITLKLTGKAVMHYSAAPLVSAFNLKTLEFDISLLEQTGINPSIIPELHTCEEIIGEITPEAAEATGLLAGTPVACGQVDCNASWIGAGAISVGDFQSNLGTVGNFGIVHKSQEFIYSPIGYLMINLPYTIDSKHTLVTVPTTMTGGQSLRFLRDAFGQSEMEIERQLGISAYDMLTLEAEKINLGSDGLVVLPFLMGERTPIWDTQARGVIFGLSLQHGKAHVVRAMMESVAYAMYDSFRLIKEAGLKVNYPMVLNEGGAVSRLWRKIISDVFNVPIVLVKRRVGAPFGDGILAGVATGTFKDFSVAKDWVEYVEPMEPSLANHERYMHYFKVYKNLYEHVKTDFQDLAKLREL